MLATIRDFFQQRGVLEIETPLLCQHTVTDRHIDSFRVENYFLQTSPEYAMKRLLAQGSGPIFQICKAFRQGEAGKKHNPEFSLLEWYRPGFDHHNLMDETDELLQLLLQTKPAKRISYRNLFLETLNIDPFSITSESLKNIITNKVSNLHFDIHQLNKDDCLNLLLSYFIEPSLGFDAPVFVYDYPSTQAALAKLRRDEDITVAERVEVYIQGVELANGFHELGDAKEQRERFLEEQQYRRERGLFVPEIDERLLDALRNGFPDCAGIAVGLDRLAMLIAKVDDVGGVLSFSWDQA